LEVDSGYNMACPLSVYVIVQSFETCFKKPRSLMHSNLQSAVCSTLFRLVDTLPDVIIRFVRNYDHDYLGESSKRKRFSVPSLNLPRLILNILHTDGVNCKCFRSNLFKMTPHNLPNL
jgi:hypothetical protein